LYQFEKQISITIDECSENYYRLIRMTTSKPQVSPPPPPARVTSESLLGTRRELLITHQGREYRLRVTQNGKLILTA
jgi:hemin uptake protein HemP